MVSEAATRSQQADGHQHEHGQCQRASESAASVEHSIALACARRVTHPASPQADKSGEQSADDDQQDFDTEREVQRSEIPFW